MTDYRLNDHQTLDVQESIHGYYVAVATSERTGETWHVITRTSAAFGYAVSAAFIGECTEIWQCGESGGPWIVGHGANTADSVARFELAEEAWSEWLRAEDGSEAKYDAEDLANGMARNF